MPQPFGQPLAQRYQFLSHVGYGAQGTVWKARDLQDPRDVAIKAIKLSSQEPHRSRDLQRLQRLLTIGSTLTHPCVVLPQELIRQDGNLYTVMAWVHGTTLDKFILERGDRLNPAYAAWVVAIVALALDAIHQFGVFHRDLKPANLVIRVNGLPVIIDFDLCRVEGLPSVTDVGRGLGTLGYMAPEQLRHAARADRVAEVYALGACLHAALTGRPPIAGRTHEQMRENLSKGWEAPPPAELNELVSDALSDVCVRARASDRARRHTSCRQLATALAEAAGFELPAVPPVNERPLRGGASRPMHAPAGGSNDHCLACGAALGLSVSSPPSCPHCGRNFGPQPPTLVVVNGPAAGRRLLIPEGDYTVGRRQIERADRRLSRQHLRIIRNNGSVAVADGGATNPTRINGIRLVGITDLGPAMSVELGSNLARVE